MQDVKKGKIRYEDAFKGRRVLITGHTGFKGSWLAIWLNELGAEVLGYSLDPPSSPNNFEASGLSGKINSVHGDINDLTFLKRSFSDFQPEFVFHLAAQPLVRYSYDRPVITFHTNILGTVNMFEAVRSAKSVRVFINVTSDKVYENKEQQQGYKEEDRVGGYDPYSSSKACSEIVTQSYIRSFFLQRENIGIASARSGNIIGGGDWGSDRLLPDCVRALSEGADIIVRNASSVRPWQFVLEPLYGYLLLASKLFQSPHKYTGAWNFGPFDEPYYSVRDIVNSVIDFWGGGGWKDSFSESSGNKYETKFLKLNCGKAYSLLGWRTLLDIDNAVKKAVEWYKTFYDYGVASAGMYDYNVNQIKEYMRLADNS